MQNISKSSPHARSHKFTKKFNGLYEDNSLSKASRLKSLLTTHGPLFKKKEESLILKIKQKQNAKSWLFTQQKFREFIEKNLKDHKIAQQIENEAAIMIQKCFRGYLYRKNNETVIQKLNRMQADKCVKKMQQVIYSMWIDVKYFKPVDFT